jgi:hypothetical protein
LFVWNEGLGLILSSSSALAVSILLILSPGTSLEICESFWFHVGSEVDISISDFLRIASRELSRSQQASAFRIGFD